MIAHRRRIVAAVVGAFCLLMQRASLMAQQFPRGSGWGAMMVMQPVMLAHGGFSAPCNPRAAKLATWGVEQIEKATKPTELQRGALSDLKSAVIKAADLRSGACPARIPPSSNERLVFLEQRLTALREAARTVIPAFEAFHASLDDEQKARLDAGPRRLRWPRS